MTHIPDLEPRFLQPDGWRWHSFEHKGRRMRFGSVFPRDCIPDAVVVCLHGVREFSEKYFETAHWCLENNFAFWTMDWVGQGKSTRYLNNPQKRHAEDFSAYAEDLHAFILGYIKHSSVHPDKGRIPLALLAHSMGANIGLRFLHQYPDFFECAAFSAPMIGIKKFEFIPSILALAAASVCNLALGKSYIPYGKDWDGLPPLPDETLTGDPQRSLIHNLWCSRDPELRTGDVTLGWVYQAHKSCMELQKSGVAERIKTPCLFGIPGHEFLVDNARSRTFINKIPRSRTLEFPDAYHEILMERPEIRDRFLDGFYTLVKETIIDRPETLKPF